MKAGGEAAFQAQVMQLARFYGWRVAHFHDSRREVVHKGKRQLVGDRDAAGFLDLVLVRTVELLFVELKGEKTRITPEQQAWIAALEQVERSVLAARQALFAGKDLDCWPDVPLPSVEVWLWRPSDFDELHARLARGRHQTEPIYRAGDLANEPTPRDIDRGVR